MTDDSSFGLTFHYAVRIPAEMVELHSLNCKLEREIIKADGKFGTGWIISICFILAGGDFCLRITQELISVDASGVHGSVHDNDVFPFQGLDVDFKLVWMIIGVVIGFPRPCTENVPFRNNIVIVYLN